MTDWIFSIFPKMQEGYNRVLGSFAPLISAIIDIIVIIVITKLSTAIAKKVIKAAFNSRIQHGARQKRMKTLSSLCCYLVTILFYLFGVCAVLNVFGLGNTVGSLLATAGIGGLAIGFGAQSIIKDFFSGAFLIFEGQIEIGDNICVAGLTGTVEKIQLRTTQIRAANGELHIIPNGNITNVTNYSRGGLLAISDIPMPYEKDPKEVSSIISAAMKKMWEETDLLLEEPVVAGIVNFGDSSIVLRVVAKAKSTQQSAAERLIRQYVYDSFKENDIAIPHNKLVVLGKEE